MIQVGKSVAAWWLASTVVFWTAYGCGGPVRYARAVDESPDHFVRLEARYGHGQGYGYDGASMPFTHPVAFSQSDVEKILKGIRLQLRKGLLTIGAKETGPKEAFTESERRYLANSLAEAFARARPDEWVVFFLSRPRGQEPDQRGGPVVTEVTSGGFYADGAQLRLVLANYRYAVSMPLLLEQIREDPLRPAGEEFYELFAGPHQTVRRLDTINTKWDLTKPVRAHLSEMTIEYQAVLAFPDEPVLAPDGRPFVEERLRALQRLRDQGLITEEEYRDKRKKLLDEL